MSDIISIVILCTAAAYVAEFAALRIGLQRASDILPDRSYEPTVSVIVAARNEEKYIEHCLLSLINVDYPREKLEIIVINDRSTDRTPEIVQRFTANYPFLKMVTTGPEQGNLRGKTNAVALGVDSSHGEILMFTDADCIVPTSWVKETVQHFDKETGIVGGFTVLKAGRPFEGMQAIDWILLFSVSSSTAGLGFPLTVIGNNLSVRRSAYELTGGYAEIPFSVTEDYALVQAILQKSDYKLRFPLQRKAAIKSAACPTWKELFRQRQRWGVGGLDMIAPGMLLMSISWILHFLLLIGLFLAPSPAWFVAAGSKITIDLYYLWKGLTELGIRRYLKYLPAFEIYYSLYVIVLPFIAVFSKKVVWKERSL